MNREQAEHILDAYVSMKVSARRQFIPDESDDHLEALREVILDAMTAYKLPSVLYPTWPYYHPTTTYTNTTRPIGDNPRKISIGD